MTERSPVSLLAAGGIIIDNVVAADGTVALDQMGGNAVYSAAGARVWCDSVGITGAVAGDYPEDLLLLLERAGVASDGLKRFPESVPLAEWFFYRQDGSRDDQLHATREEGRAAGILGQKLSREHVTAWKNFLSSHRTEGLSFADFRRSHPVELDFIPLTWRRPGGVHLAPEKPQCQLEIARAMKAEGVVVTLDPGAAVRHINYDMLCEILRTVDAFLPSEKELRALAEGADIETALGQIAALGSATVGVKLGVHGSCIFDRVNLRVVEVPAFRTDAVDPTGAGDAYCGGFLAGLVETGDAVKAACFGTVSASFAVEHFGALREVNPTRAAADERLASLSRSIRSSHGASQ